MKRLAISGLLVFFSLGISSLHAGFGGGGVTPVPITESPITKERLERFDQEVSAWDAGGQSGSRPTYPDFEDVAQSQIDQMQAFPPYSGMTDAAVTERVRQMRRALVCVIELIKADDPATGRNLERLLGLGKICFGLADPPPQNVGATIFPDGKADFGIEPINILYDVSKDLSLTDQETFKLYVAMAHEALHGKQEILRPTGTIRTVREAVDLQCREIEAHEQEVAQYDEMIRLLEHYRDHGDLPADARGGTKAIAEAIARADTAAGDNKLLDGWLTYLARERQQRSYIVRFRTIYKEAGQARIDGTLDAEQLERQLVPFQPWVAIYGESRDFRLLQTLIYNPDAPVTVGPIGMREVVPPGNTVRQISQNNTKETDIIIPDCDSVTDGFIAEEKNRLYYVGIRFGTPNQGVIGCYDLDPVTQEIMPATQQTCIEDTRLGGGCRLVENPSTGECFGLEVETAVLFLLEDTDGDDLFDVLVPSGSIPQGPGMKVADAFFCDANTICGTPSTPDSCPDALQPISMASRPGPGSDFSGGPPQLWKDIFSTGPSIGTLPYEGRGDLICTGTPGRDFGVWYEPPGGPARQVGSGTFSWGGSGCADLSEPIGQDPLRIIDNTGAQSPLIVCAPAPGSPQVSAGPVFSDDTIIINTSGFPGEMLDSQSSGTLLPSGWTDGPGVRADCFGGAQFDFTRMPGVDRQFYRFGPSSDQVPPPVPAPTFSAVSGITACFDISQPGCYKYEIVEGPGLHPDVFQFFPDGRFAITPINLEEDYSFTYRTVVDGLLGFLFGDPITVEIEGDTAPLTDPEPFTGADGQQQVNALVLPYAGQHFPLYQFWVRNSPSDECKDPHWHAIFNDPVFSFENPENAVNDPASGNCGFGKRKDLSPVLISVTLAEWEAFKADHPPSPIFP